MKRFRGESGAAAVEFALIATFLLIPLVVGIMEFSRAYNNQISLTSAAREGVRVMAIKNSAAEAKTATLEAAPSLDPVLTDSEITVEPTDCTSGGRATVTIKYRMDFISGWFGTGIDLEGKGVMRCNG